jgi:hypothetical protein
VLAARRVAGYISIAAVLKSRHGLAPLAALLLSACGPTPGAPLPPPAPPAAPASASLPDAPPLSAAAWGTFSSARFELRLPLPDGHAWRIDDHGGPWLSATHAASESSLVARSWTEDGRATRRRCEEQARLWRTMPDPARAEEVQARSIDAPAGFDTFVSIGITPGKPDDPVAGFAVAFGGHGHRCFAWAYTTTARGAGAGLVLGERLATMVERSLGRVVLESELSPHIPREPAP